MMKPDHTKLLNELERSEAVQTMRRDAEAARQARRREAIMKQAALAESEREFKKSLEAALAEIESRQNLYEEAQKAATAAGSELYLAMIKRDELLADRQKAEAEARSAVLKECNPNRWTLLFTPLREEIEKTRLLKPVVDREGNGVSAYPHGKGMIVAAKTTTPSIVARMAFVERALYLIDAHLLAIDDDDATLIRVRETILAAAPGADRLVEIALGLEGMRRARDRATETAIDAAEKLALEGFGVGAFVNADPVVVPLKRAAGKA